jgi:hypothetical protein
MIAANAPRQAHPDTAIANGSAENLVAALAADGVAMRR